MANEKKVIKRTNWLADFNLVGKPVINDYTYKIDAQSQKSDWIYNSLNLGVDCGEKHGTVYCEMMGGYSANSESILYKHGKLEGGNNTDFSKQVQVAWSERFDADVIDEIGDSDFIKVGLVKTSEGKTYVERFLSEYDAIAYIKEHLTPDMVINVRGQLKYSLYNGNTQVKKVVQSIFLSRVEDPTDFKAMFRQSILLDKDSASMKDIDKETGTLYVNARVLDYIRDLNGVEIKGQFPMNKQFEYRLDLTKLELCKKIVAKLFAPKKGVTQITFEGEFVESGAVVNATEDDIPDDIMDLVKLEIFTLEQALAKCSSNGSRQRSMVLKTPMTRKSGEDDNQTTVLQIFPEAYTEDELDVSWAYVEAENNDDGDEDEFVNETKSSSNTDSDDWMNDDWFKALDNM